MFRPQPVKSISFLPDLAGLYGFITFVLLVIFDRGKILVDGDTFWHISAGKHMLAKGAILTHDIFSHTASGIPWTSHEWLSEIIMAWIHQNIGLTGIAIFYFLITALSFQLLYRIISRIAGDCIAIVATSIALEISITHILARPHIFSWFLGVITLYALYKGGKWSWLLPPITALWANLHGGFILGLALQALFLLGNVLNQIFSTQTKRTTLFLQIKRPTKFLIFSILASGINPFGFSLYLFPFQVTSGAFSSGIKEWLAPDLHQEWEFRLFLISILFGMSLKNIPTTWTDRLFVLFFFNASLIYQRYMSMTAIFLSPYFAKMLKVMIYPFKRYHHTHNEAKQLPTSPLSGPVGTILLAIALAIFAGPTHPKAQSVLETFIPVSSKKHPIEAVEYLNRTHPSGKMFNKYSWGGYLIYALEPNQKVFIDGRADMYGEEIFSDYLKIASLDNKTEELLSHYHIDWILFPTDSVLIRYLKTTGKWQENYSDEVASILTRRLDKLP